MHQRAKDYTGRTFGCLTATKYVGAKRRSVWEFQCACGNKVTRAAIDVEKYARRGGNPSCGCQVGKQSVTHAMSAHPAYRVWRSMRDRCRLPTHQAWHNYGGRGITVCEAWDQSFEAFWSDMGPTYAPGLTLDRKDNNLGYSPENCRWVSMKVQAGNRRRALPVDLAEAHRLTGVPLSTLGYRWKRSLCMTSSTPDPERASWSGVLRGRS